MVDALQKVEISDCPRCGGTHNAVAEYLVNPPDDEDWRFWAACPVVEQPVMIAADDDGNLTGET